MPIYDQTAAIELFCLAADQHEQATKSGEYRLGTRTYAQLVEAVRWLEEHQVQHQLLPLLESGSIGIRPWAAAALLRHDALKAEAALTALASRSDLGIQQLNAKMLLQEWRAGRFKGIY
jgi:hypothetical protein